MIVNAQVESIISINLLKSNVKIMKFIFIFYLFCFFRQHRILHREVCQKTAQKLKIMDVTGASGAYWISTQDSGPSFILWLLMEAGGL